MKNLVLYKENDIEFLDYSIQKACDYIIKMFNIKKESILNILMTDIKATITTNNDTLVIYKMLINNNSLNFNFLKGRRFDNIYLNSFKFTNEELSDINTYGHIIKTEEYILKNSIFTVSHGHYDNLEIINSTLDLSVAMEQFIAECTSRIYIFYNNECIFDFSNDYDTDKKVNTYSYTNDVLHIIKKFVTPI